MLETLGAADEAPVVEVVGFVTLEPVAGRLAAVGAVDVGVVDVELVVEPLPAFESPELPAHARPAPRSTTAAAPAARGIRYFTVDPPLVLRVQCPSRDFRSASADCQGSVKPAAGTD
jgi:hypothetical protein